MNKDLSDKLNAIYGTDTAGAQKAILAIRLIAATTGAAGTAKAATSLSEGAALAVGRKLDEIALAKAEAQTIAARMKEIAIHKDGDLFTEVAEKMVDAKRAGWKTPEGRIWWPPENGKVPGTGFQTTLPRGTKLDRYGAIGPDTDFLAPAGAPYTQRALAPGSDIKPIVRLEVIKPLPVEQSNVMPWFNQPGMGIQYQTTAGDTKWTVRELIDNGYLKEIK